jgi:hypothetical protein
VALGLLGLAGAAGWLAFTELGYATKDIQLLVPGNNFGRYADWARAFAADDSRGMTMHVVAGVLPADDGDPYDPEDRGALARDAGFDPAAPATQVGLRRIVALHYRSPTLYHIY